MKHKLILVLLLSLATLSTTGCSQLVEQVKDLFAPTVDATTTDTFIDSMQKVRTELSQSERDKFDDAITYFSLEYVKKHPKHALVAGAAAILADDSKLGNAITDTLSKDYMMQFHGKKARAIIREHEKALNP